MTDLSDGLHAIFERHRGDFLHRVQTLEAAFAELLCGSLDEAQRATAQHDAHTLVGSLGAYGRHRGSELAGDLEQRFASSLPAQTDDQRLGQVLSALRDQIDGPPLIEQSIPARPPGPLRDTEGGPPGGRSTLVCGPAGCGKTPS